MVSYDCYIPPNVKIKELDAVSVNSQVVTPFCISWSEDNKISLVVEGGVFIFELWPSPLTNQPTFTFCKSWIPACSLAPLSNVISNEHGAFLWSLSRKQAFETCVDSTLSYAVQKPNSTSGSSQVIQCEFSPLIGSKSYISCLTNHGLLQIYKDTLKKWEPVMNITQLWMSHCSCKANERNTNYEAFKSEMLKLKIMTMKWVKEPEITFITGHENGEIVFWKVDIVNENFGMSVKFSVQITGKPLHLHLCSLPDFENSLLFVGKLSGAVECLSVNLNLGESYGNFDLWENEDSFHPNLIVTKYLVDKLFVFSIKRHILLIQTLFLTGLKQIELLDTQWEEFSTTITGWSEYQDSFVISLQNHDIFKLNIILGEERLIFENMQVDVEVKKKLKNSYSCFGLTMSQNEAIWILAVSPKQNYESLKDITHLIICSPDIKVFRSLVDCTSSGLIEKILNNYPNTQLSEIFDLLELKKLELLSDLTKFRHSYESSEDLPLLNLQLLLWEVKLKLFCNYLDTDSLITEIEFSITRNRARKVVDDLQNLNSLSEMQRRSLDVCQMFLMDFNEKGKSLDEVCVICGYESFCYNIRISSCSNLHKFPRCCLSLLPCVIAPYAICKICEAVALTNFVVEGDNRCPYCDGLLEFDPRFHSSL